MTRAAVIALLLAARAGCVDTEPGLAVNAESAAITVTGDGATTEVAADIDLSVRVGKHAPAGRMFILPNADLYVGDTLAARLSLDIPAGFRGTLQPDQSDSYTIHGETVMPGGFPEARSLLCTGSAQVTVLVLWQAQIETEDIAEPFRMEMGSAEVTTSDVTCP